MSPRKKKRYQRGEYVSSKTGLLCKYRSGWELAYMQYLDSSQEVKEWLYESFSIEYVSNKQSGKIRRYIPDFKIIYLDGSIELVEVKPKKKLGQLMIRKKCDAANAWCMTHGMAFKIVTENELRSLGLIK
jgi:hypothetical protein